MNLFNLKNNLYSKFVIFPQYLINVLENDIYLTTMIRGIEIYFLNTEIFKYTSRENF